MAKVVLTPDAGKGLGDLPLVIHARVLSLLQRLEKWPNLSGARPLTGKLAGHYRLRTGHYRLQFRVQSQTVIVEKIGHRDRFYD